MAQAREKRAELIGPFGRKAIRIGRLFGIEVGLDWSWLFIFALITLSLSQQLALGHEGWGGSVVWAAAIVTSLLFFVSILLHELGHSITSNKLGLPVRSITLFLFGGLASLSGEPTRPRDEFLIGAAGPLVSVALGLGFLALGALLPGDALWIDVTRAVAWWLGTINLLLAAFNLFPGFPLDGGHLLRAGIWSWTGDRQRSTQIASAMGAMFAMALIGFGIFSALFMGNMIGGLWLALIGWFILTAARRTSTQAVLERELGAIRVADAMAPPPPSVPADETVGEVIEGPVLLQGRRSLLVEESGEPVGLLTLHEIKNVPKDRRGSTTAGEIMIPRERVVTTTPEATLWDAMTKMERAGVNQLPVVEGGRLTGMIGREQLLGVIRNVMELEGNGKG